MQSTKSLGKKLKIFAVIIAAIAIGLFVALFYYSLYPRNYDVVSTVKENCETFSLNENLVFSIIKCESGFDPAAVSDSGAVGLMQLMPETAAFIAEKVGLKAFDLTNPKDNLLLGCAYLRYLFDKFSTVNAVLAAYNAGEGRVVRWLADQNYSDDGKNLKAIPIKETAVYVKRVRFYSSVYKFSDIL